MTAGVVFCSGLIGLVSLVGGCTVGFRCSPRVAGLAFQPAKPVAGFDVSIAVPVSPPGPRRGSNRAGLSLLTHKGWLLLFEKLKMKIAFLSMQYDGWLFDTRACVVLRIECVHN